MRPCRRLRDTNQPRGPRAEVAPEDVHRVGAFCLRGEVGGFAFKEHPAAIAREQRMPRIALPGGAARRYARQNGHVRRKIAHENVARVIGVSRHQVAGATFKGDELAVGGNRRRARWVIAATDPAGVHADQGGAIGLEVSHKHVHVWRKVVIGHEVACPADEHELAAIGTEQRRHRITAARIPRRGEDRERRGRGG